MGKKEELVEIEAIHRIKYEGEYKDPGTCFSCESSIAETLLEGGAAKEPGEVIGKEPNPIAPDLDPDPNAETDDEDEQDAGVDDVGDEAIISL